MVYPKFHNIILCLNKHNIQTRPNANQGLWLMFLLPLALICSAARHPIIATATYKLSSIFSIGLICSSLIFIYECSKIKRLRFLNVGLLIACLITAVLFRICLHRGLIFSFLSAIASTIIYQKLYLLILQKLPNTFTLGEAAIFSQSYVLLLYFTSLNVFHNFQKPASSVMQISTLINQIGLTAISTIFFLLYKFGIKNPSKFYILTGTLILFLLLLPLQILMRQNPLFWILNLFWEDLQKNKVLLFWVPSTILAVTAINWRISKAKKASTSVRKIFHFLSVVVFIPGLFLNCSLLYLSSGVVLGIFFMLEVLRILNIPPLAETLQNGMVIFGDEKDTGIIALTPMYLLAGCSLPMWVHPSPCDVTNSAVFNLLPLLSGVLTIGIGDTAASIVGSKFGKYHWKDSPKTVEGTLACIISQFFVIGVCVYFEYIKFFTFVDYGKIFLAVIVTSVVEAKTDQVDNLVLPFIMYFACIL